MVKESNELVKAGESHEKSLQTKTGHLTRSFLPEVSLHAGQESFTILSNRDYSQPFFGASLSLNLFNGGRDLISERIFKSEFEQGKANQLVNVAHQLEAARKTFWEAVYLKVMIEEMASGLKTIQANRNSALKRIKSGVATQSDRFEFDIKESEIQQDIKKSELELSRVLGQLKIHLGMDSAVDLKITEDLDHDHNWKNFMKHSEEDHDYLLKPLELESKSFELKKNLAQLKWMPKLDAYALWLQNTQRSEYDLSSASDREQTVLGVRAIWTLSDFVSGRAQKNEMTHRLRANELQLNYQKRELENEIHMEIKELDLLDEMVHTANENIERLTKFFKMISEEYRRGVKTSGDMLSASEKLIDSKIRRLKIIRDFQFAKSHLMTKLGE